MTKRNISEAENSKRFSTPRQVVLFLEKVRWGGRPECPHCKAPKPKKRGGKRIGQYICKACGKEFNVRTGTIFQGTRLCLTIWMKAIYHLLNERSGVSSTKLAVFLGVTQLSSWFLLHRLRHACGGCDELLEGVLEADETYLGGLEKNKHADKKSRRSRGRSLLKKLGILGLVQRSENGVKARYWARCMDRLDAESIRREINRRMRPDALLVTDEAPPCNSFRRKTVNHSRGQYVNGIASTNMVESLWAVVKRAFKGVHVKISRERINRHLDEATFRLNEFSKDDTYDDALAAFAKGAFRGPLTWRQLMAERGDCSPGAFAG